MIASKIQYFAHISVIYHRVLLEELLLNLVELLFLKFLRTSPPELFQPQANNQSCCSPLKIYDSLYFILTMVSDGLANLEESDD